MSAEDGVGRAVMVVRTDLAGPERSVDLSCALILGSMRRGRRATSRIISAATGSSAA